MEYELSEKDKLQGKPESEENFWFLSSFAQDAIIQINERGLIVYWNKSAERLFGLSETDVLNKSFHLLFAPERYLEAQKKAFAKFRNSGEGAAINKTLELEGKRKNGEEFPIELSLSSFQINGEWNAVGIVRDITKRKEAENKIKERLKELTCLYELSKIAVEKTLDTDSFLKEAINLIPPAWQFPELVCAKITVEGKEYKTDNYKETKWRQISKIYIENQKIGEIEVCYLEETPIFDEGPFLKEERNLINGISDILSGVLELKLTEEKLKKSEVKHRNIINHLDVAFYQVLLDGKLLNHNPMYNMILGYEPSLNLKNTNVKLLWENPELRKTYLEQLLKDGYVKNYICHALKKDGTKVVLQLNSHVIRDKEGKSVRIDGTFIDATEKFVLEQKLKRTLETTKKVLEALPMGIILVGNDKKIQSVNKAALSLLGYSNEFEILGKDWYDNTCLTEKNACPLLDDGKEREQTEVYLKHKSGNEVPVLKQVLPITLGNMDYLMEAFVDITSLKEIQNQLKESQEKYLDLIETSTLGILEISLIENKIEYVNPAFIDIIECSLKDIKTENLFYKMIHPDDISQLMSSREKRDIEFRILLRDGTTKWVAATRLYTYGINQQPINLRLWVIDITERKKSDRLKEKFTEHLEREVKYRTKDLKDLLEKQRLYLDQIEKSSRFKTEFLATMSHELRTPLNAIIGFTDLLVEGVFGELNEEQIEYINDIDDSSKHLLDMITHILDISKIESGQATLKIEEIQLNNIIAQVISILKPLYIEKDIKWELIGLKKEQFIFADRIKFKQIIYNLLSNAIKFTKNGKIIFEFKENKKDWEFAVKDTGIGISEKDFDIIFKDFKRVKSDYVDATQGTGLGLALTKRLINIQGGDISFSSKLEKGTTFTFNLPKTLKEKSTSINKVESFLNKL